MNVPIALAFLIPAPLLGVGLWLLQRPLARLELGPDGVRERTWWRRRLVMPLDDLAEVRVESRRARWDGLALFWTRVDSLVFVSRSGETVPARRFWRYGADPIVGSAVTRAAERLNAIVTTPDRSSRS